MIDLSKCDFFAYLFKIIILMNELSRKAIYSLIEPEQCLFRMTNRSRKKKNQKKREQYNESKKGKNKRGIDQRKHK